MNLRRHLRCSYSLAAVCLTVLAIQNSLLVVMTRLSRSGVPLEDNYNTWSLIMTQEVMKLVMCVVIFAWSDVRKVRRGVSGQSMLLDVPDSEKDSNPVTVVLSSKNGDQLLPFWRTFCSSLWAIVFTRDTLRLFIPAAMFTGQNFLTFVGLSNLDPVSFQVWSQTRLLWAALFSAWLLERHLTKTQWAALVLLTTGVFVTQLNAGHSVPAGVNSDLDWGKDRQAPVPAKEPPMATTGSSLLGIGACVISGISSSYAGVYLERIVKFTRPTLSVRNIQLSIFGLPIAFAFMVLLDVIPSWRAQAKCKQSVHWQIYLPGPTTSAKNRTDGCPVRPFYMWQRYDVWLTWGIVVVHAVGGIVVAAVVKYADNILKGFATGVAVILSGAMSAVLWGYQPTAWFVVGALMVLASTIVFHKGEAKQQPSVRLLKTVIKPSSPPRDNGHCEGGSRLNELVEPRQSHTPFACSQIH